MGLPRYASGQELPADAGDVRAVGSVPGSTSAPGGGHSNPPQSLPWRIPWTADPGGPQSMRSHRVRRLRPLSPQACTVSLFASGRLPHPLQMDPLCCLLILSFPSLVRTGLGALWQALQPGSSGAVTQPLFSGASAQPSCGQTPVPASVADTGGAPSRGRGRSPQGEEWGEGSRVELG